MSIDKALRIAREVGGVARKHRAKGGAVDENTGLPMNRDGTVNLYHHTNANAASQIMKSGVIKSAGEPHVYATTHKETNTGYGNTAVPIRVHPRKLELDDEFPNGRKDYRVSVGKPGGSIPVGIGHPPEFARGGRLARAEGGRIRRFHHVGPIHSSVAGRTDHLPMTVHSGSYVLPADIISASGEGNTIAGFKHAKRVFGGTPYAGGSQPYNHEGGPYGMADGGSAHGGVPIVAAGGEYVLHPDQVREVGGGDLDLGHKVLDEFVKRQRAELVKTLKKLPAPRRD